MWVICSPQVDQALLFSLWLQWYVLDCSWHIYPLLQRQPVRKVLQPPMLWATVADATVTCMKWEEWAKPSMEMPVSRFLWYSLPGKRQNQILLCQHTSSERNDWAINALTGAFSKIKCILGIRKIFYRWSYFSKRGKKGSMLNCLLSIEQYKKKNSQVQNFLEQKWEEFTDFVNNRMHLIELFLPGWAILPRYLRSSHLLSGSL